MTAARRRALVVVLTVLTLVTGLVPATARQVGPRRLVYRCTLETTKEGTEITVTLRLRTNAPRDDWRIRLFHDEEPIFRRVRTTNPRGNLAVVRVEPNLPGRDSFLARTRHLGSTNRCTVDAEI